MNNYSRVYLTGSGICFGLAIIAAFVAISFIRLQAFSSVFVMSFQVRSSALAGVVGEIAPNAMSTTVEILSEVNQPLVRALTGLALGFTYSPAVFGFMLLGVIMLRLKINRYVEKLVPLGVLMFAVWIILSSFIAQILNIFAGKLFLANQDLPITPIENSVWVEVPSFHISPELVTSICVGLVLIAGSLLISRGLRAEKELGGLI